MASTRIKDLASAAVRPAHEIAIDHTTPTDATTKATIAAVFAGMGIVGYTVATLPTGATGRMIFVSDGRKVGEGAAAGTGVLCYWNGSNWVTHDASTTVAA